MRRSVITRPRRFIRGREEGAASRLRRWSFLALAAQQLRQFGDVGGDAPGLVVCEHVRLPGLVVVSPEVGVGDRLLGSVLDAERLLKFSHSPGRRKLAGRHRAHTRVIAGLSGLIHICPTSP
jgi:hypothetical protein